MKLPLSNRLLACCNYVNQGDRVADIGCDHGYLGIYLVSQGIAQSVIASDVNEQPLQSAMIHAKKFGVKGKMAFYLSDGLQNIPREFDTLVCAGMGGDTMMGILSQAPWLRDPRYRLILQCQSHRPELRQWLYNAGFAITRETLAQDGKFLYPVTEVTYAPGGTITPAQCYITPQLLESGSPLLPAFWQRVVTRLELTVAGLAHSGDDRLTAYQEILRNIREMEEEIHGSRQ